MTDKNKNHPADALSLALDRSAGLLASVGDLYDPFQESFSGGNAFVAHALATASALVVEAKEALSDLHFCCDLTLLDSPDHPVMTVDLGQPFPSEIGQEIESPFENTSSNVAFSDSVETIEDNGAFVQDGEFAQSYLELLRKLTAAEVFASEQQALSVPGTSTELLPLLKSLREDLQRLHRAA